MTSLLLEYLKQNPIQSQRDAIRLSVRQSIASLGPMDVELIPGSVLGIVKGLFGPAYDAAPEAQRARWTAICEEEYRRAIGWPDNVTA